MALNEANSSFSCTSFSGSRFPRSELPPFAPLTLCVDDRHSSSCRPLGSCPPRPPPLARFLLSQIDCTTMWLCRIPPDSSQRTPELSCFDNLWWRTKSPLPDIIPTHHSRFLGWLCLLRPACLPDTRFL
ncbi:unnamed protein product [Prunus armeniaca]|uniref:Uncharacterized protein n=1 Tax=Prunus armeniaca TaxID=36596 RepID=A0A6J5THX5_PRUAR|nr:unnamed protein product [Prunus armeniaca]